MKFFLFEIKYWLRQPMVYIFFVINTLMIFGATYSDSIVVGGSFGNILKNAPFVIQMYYSIMSIITLLMTTSFILASTIRDFNYNTYQIIFTTPVKRIHYLLGKFLGAAFISMLPLLGISLGIIIACLMPDMDPERVGPIIWQAHFAAFLQLAVPNTIFSAAVVFILAALTRSTVAAFLGSLLLLVATGIAGSFAEDLDKEWLAILLDPYGTATFSVLTKYWTVSQKNTIVLPLSGLYFLNRCFWLLISGTLIFITVKVFSFTEKSRSSKKLKKLTETSEAVFVHHKELPSVSRSFEGKAMWVMLRTRMKYEILGIIKSPTFIILMLAGLMNFIPSLISNSGPYGLTAWPVTYSMIDMMQGTFYAFLIAIIIIYSGLLVWKERDNKFDEIYDATPHPTWVSYLSKLISMAVIIFIVQLICIATSMVVQLGKGFVDIRPGVYFSSLLGIDYWGLIFLVIMAMFIHSLVNNKYVAFFVFVIFLLANNFMWVMLEVESNMVQYSGRPAYTYSDMNGFGPYISGIGWFRFYWGLFAFMLALFTILASNRGKETSGSNKLKMTVAGLKRKPGIVIGVVFIFWFLTAGFVFYNTQVLNDYQTSKQTEKLQSEYEKQFKKYEGLNQPRITDIKYNIELFPSDRKVVIKTTWWIKNKSETSIDSIHFSFPQDFDIVIDLPGAKKVADFHDLGYCIYKLAHPMNSGDSLELNFTSTYDANGFENEVRFHSIVDNGSFFNNENFSPQIGYQPSAELQDRDKRKKYGLKEAARMPALERNCSAHCMNNYISNHADWVNVETIFSTSSDQIAVAPGSLLKKWTQNGRNYFHYKLDHPSLNFYSFISARYEVMRSKYKGIDVEVYYDSKHPYNIDNMEKSMKKSLEYYLTNFGPYYHKQVRIIEFPRYESFAQAFPGSMPYSEGIGFIARIEDEDDIDMVFYVVAHEMGHQYWAHQLVGANMQGATVLSETFAQYSALMVMEKEYGRDAMKKFLKYEMDEYLRSRGTERLKELPLMYVENQGYVHYRKGSLVMYYLKEMIGEENVNKSLRKLLADHAYEEPPYAVSYHAVDAFKENTPDSLQYIIHDLFETITLYSNRAKNATVKSMPGNKYELTLDVSSQKFRADSLGKETEIPVNDWIEIGAFEKPEGDKLIGKVIYRQKYHITTKDTVFKVILDKMPYEAGIDPLNLMVDLVSDDNITKVNSPAE